MKFKVGDRITIHAEAEELQLDLFQEIDGLTGEISEIYSKAYEPGVKRYEITLDEPITLNGEELTVIDGLYEDNLELENLRESSDQIEKYTSTFEAYSEEADLNWYYGIADCHGIESFMMEPSPKRWSQMDRLKHLGLSDTGSAEDPEKKKFGGNLNLMMMRARANSQRHPVVYRVSLSKDDADEIQSMLNLGEYDDALIFLKSAARETQIARGHGVNPERAWSMIPNHELDPFWGGASESKSEDPAHAKMRLKKLGLGETTWAISCVIEWDFAAHETYEKAKSWIIDWLIDASQPDFKIMVDTIELDKWDYEDYWHDDEDAGTSTPNYDANSQVYFILETTTNDRNEVKAWLENNVAGRGYIDYVSDVHEEGGSTIPNHELDPFLGGASESKSEDPAHAKMRLTKLGLGETTWTVMCEIDWDWAAQNTYEDSLMEFMSYADELSEPGFTILKDTIVMDEWTESDHWYEAGYENPEEQDDEDLFSTPNYGARNYVHFDMVTNTDDEGEVVQWLDNNVLGGFISSVEEIRNTADLT